MLRHVAVIGKTGSGKSVLLEHLIVADLHAGRGFALLDPHGDLVDRVLSLVPRRRKNDVILFNPSVPAHALPMNLLERVEPRSRPRVASGVLAAFRKVYAPQGTWGPRLEHIFRNALLALLEVPRATIADVPRLLLEERFRAMVVEKVTDPIVRHFWLVELPSYGRMTAEIVAPVLNKVGAVLTNPMVRAVVGRSRSAFDVRQVMDDGRVLLARLAKGELGEDASAILGALLLARIQVAAYSRASSPPESRRQFHLYVDEAGSFATTAFGEMLSEARKFGVGVVLACQYVGQLDERLRDAVLANVRTLVCFRLGAEDAEVVGAEMEPEITARDLMRLGEHQIALRLSVGGATSVPFTAVTLAPVGIAPGVPIESQGHSRDATQMS
ncbi:MAG: type IV secretion system DNA-binding domain-containing protein [Deltaproteobacteria bacterium]|nr:type IV secretion system DNA-binding domain-containing protein [Deltaproteobacteria bacterium]